MFQKWDYFRMLKGKNDDWVNCVAGCDKHDYSPQAIEFLAKFEFIADKSVLSKARAHPHCVCRVLCELHKGINKNQPRICCGGTPSRAAQHFIQKLLNAPNINQLPLHAYLQAGWTHINVCRAQNKDPTRGQNMSAYSSPEIHKAPSISLSGSQSPAPTFPSTTNSTISDFIPKNLYKQYQQKIQQQQGIVLNQYYHCNFNANPSMHFQNESTIDTFCSQEGDREITTIYKGRMKIKRRLRAYNKC